MTFWRLGPTFEREPYLEFENNIRAGYMPEGCSCMPQRAKWTQSAMPTPPSSKEKKEEEERYI